MISLSAYFPDYPRLIANTISQKYPWARNSLFTFTSLNDSVVSISSARSYCATNTRKTKMRLCVIMPAYNEASVIAGVIKQIPKKILGVHTAEVVVIDDNSTDNTSKVAKGAGATVLTHRLNLGAGGATMTGLEYARRNNFDAAVTMDSDGQHDPADIERLVKRIIDGSDLVIGSRLVGFKRGEMPMLKWVGNNLFNFITFLFYGVWVTDSQSGFKAFSKKALEKCQVESAGYEVCSVILGKAKAERLMICEEPIKTIYTDYSKKKGQHYLNGFNIVIRLALSKIKGSL